MALHVGLAVNAQSTDAVDVRLALAGAFVRDTSGLVRSGILPNRTDALVTARSDMSVNVLPFNAVTSRAATYGALPFNNDSSATVGPFTAPTSNSWIVVVWVKHNDTGQGDANNLPVFGFTTGTAAATPVSPAIPTGAIGLASVTVPSTATTTGSSGVVITQAYNHAATQGSALYFRSSSAMTSETGFMPGTLGYLISNGLYYVFNGSGWVLLSRSDDTGWQTLNLNTGFTANTSGSGAVPQYRRINGTVYFRGRFDKTSTSGQVIGILPSGFLPAVGANVFLTLGNTSSVTARIVVGLDGTLTITETAALTAVALAPISFPADA